jgi:hypothetical protein
LNSNQGGGRLRSDTGPLRRSNYREGAARIAGWLPKVVNTKTPVPSDKRCSDALHDTLIASPAELPS